MIDGNRVLAIIPARGGSKGIPGKNIYPVFGRPLIEWTIEAAKKSFFLDRVILSSDDDEIIEVARRAGCEVPFRRELVLGSDEATSIDVVLDAIRRVPGYDIVVLLQPTSPLRTSKDIDGALKQLVEEKAPACVSIRETLDHPAWSFSLDAQGRLKPFLKQCNAIPSRRQDLEAAWQLNGAIYVAVVSWLVEKRAFLTAETIGFSMPLDRSIDIDTYEDMRKFELIVESSS